MWRLFSCLAVLWLVGCGTVEKENWMPVQNGARIAADPVLAERALSGNTIWDSSTEHGSQYEYHAPDGVSFLWYPGNARTVRGQWRLEGETAPLRVCYRYGANTYNPVTRRPGGAWGCRPLRGTKFSGGSLMRGNPFGLGPGKVPFVIPPRQFVTPEDIAARLGLEDGVVTHITSIDGLTRAR